MRQRHLASSTVFILLKRQDRVCLIKRATAQREALEEVGVQIAQDDLSLVQVLQCLSEAEAWTGHLFVTENWQGQTDSEFGWG
jgi:8-oxo-dGTP pyrophosphatase MutT (NUDIX family)